MKKVLLLGLCTFATFALTGCEMIEGLLKGGEDLLNEKKDYKYDDFAVLIADKDFSFSYTTCTAAIEEGDDKSSIEFKYDKEDKEWHYSSMIVNDKEITKEGTKKLDLVSYVKNFKTIAELLGKKVDNVYKFSASKNGYFVTASYKDDEKQVDGEYNFNTEGLVTSENEKMTNLDTVKAVTRKVTYSYFE